MNFKRLRVLLIAAFLLVSIVPLSILGYKAISQGEKLIKEKASSYLLSLSEKNAESINGFMTERAHDINVLSYTISTFGQDKELLNNHLRKVKNQYKVYLAFFVLDKGGEPVFSIFDDVFSYLELSHHIHQSKVSWLNVDISDLFILNYAEEQVPTVMICTPILDETANCCGTLCALVDFRYVDSMLKKSNIEVTGEVYLIDKAGRFLTTSRFGAKALINKVSVASIGKDEKGIYETVDYRGKNVLQAYKKVEYFPWYVISDQDRSEVLERISELQRETIVYGILTVMIVFCLAFFVSTVIVNMLKDKYRYEKELEFQVVQKDKLAALGLLTSGLAHELNTPLANALLYTQIAKEELGEARPEIIRSRLSTVEQEVKQGSKIVRNLLGFSRHSLSSSKSTDVNETIDKLMSISSPHCESKKIRIEKHLEEGMPEVRADTSIVQGILTNIVANAVESMPDGGTLKLTTRYVPVLHKVKIEIADSGPGIPKDDIAQIFNPFFTTKKQGKGTGLGLFVCHEMTRKLGGDIKVISSTGEGSTQSGTVFTIELLVEDS